MYQKIKAIVKKYHLIEHACSAAFNISRLIGFISSPLYKFPFRRRIILSARAGYWSSKLGKMGKGVQIDSKVVIRHQPEMVEIGDFSTIYSNVHFEVHGPIKIGKYVDISPYAYIQSAAEVIIGDFACIGNGVKIYAETNTYKTPDQREKKILLSFSCSTPPELFYIEKKPVIIKDYAYLGTNSVVLPGVRIGRGAIVGAGAVVTKDIPPYMIAVGVPARPVKKRPIPESEKEVLKEEI